MWFDMRACLYYKTVRFPTASGDPLSRGKCMTGMDAASSYLKGIEDQIAILRTFFGPLASYDKKFLDSITNNETRLPDGAEGWFVIPRWQVIGQGIEPRYTGAPT